MNATLRPPVTSDDLTRSLDLVRKAQGGDGASLNRLIERYYERLRRIVRVRLGRRLREVVDSGDILQDTFAAAVKAFDGFEVRDEASLIHWLSRLAERQIIAQADYHGAKKRDQARRVPLEVRPAGGDETFEVAFADEATAPLDRLARGEEAERVEECLSELPEAQRDLILLRNYAGMSWEAIAEETGRPSPAAARMMHARALVELGKRLRDSRA